MGNNSWLFKKPYKKEEVHLPAVDSELWQKIQSLTFLQGRHGLEDEFYGGVLELMKAMADSQDMTGKNAVALLIEKQELFLNKQVYKVCQANDHKPMMNIKDIPVHLGRWGFRF